MQEVATEDGETWFIAAAEMFGDTDDKELVALVFSKRMEALNSLESMNKLIKSTQLIVASVAIAGCVFTAVVVLWTVVLLARHVSAPLEVIQKASALVVAESVKKPKQRDYGVVAKTVAIANTKDELQDLSQKFQAVVTKLWKVDEAKKKRPKYPSNPFRGNPGIYQQNAEEKASKLLTVADGTLTDRASAPEIRITATEVTGNSLEITITALHTVGELRAQVCAESGASPGQIQLVLGDTMMVNDFATCGSYGVKDGSDVSIIPGSNSGGSTVQTETVNLLEEGVPPEPLADHVGQATFDQKVTCCGSLKSKLLRPVGGLLLSLLLAVMALVVILLASGGQEWTVQTKDVMIEEVCLNLILF